MKTNLALTVLGGALLLGAATGTVASAVDGDDRPEPPAASSAPTPSTGSSSVPTSGGGEQGAPTAAPGLLPAERLTITPGAVGPVRVGMTKAQAVATGYLVADVAAPADGCPTRPLNWRDEYLNALDLQTAGNGEVLSIGVRGEGVDTADGFGVGTTWGELRSSVSEPEAAGYGQTGVYVRDQATAGWIGYLFDDSPEKLTDASTVSFVEVTKGGQPSLVRDGC
jgi:hypothetical protein